MVGLSVLVLGARVAGADAVTAWNENAGKAATAACLAPAGNALAESRMYAMMHAAVHDAVNAIDRRSRPYTFDRAVTATASADAAVAAAARGVLVPVISTLQELPACIAAGLASTEASYAAALAAIPDGAAKSDGIALGEATAAAIVALRASDGADAPFADFGYVEGTRPGEWRFTADGPPLAFGPTYGNVTPFVLQHGAQFRPAPPYKVTSKQYAADYDEIKALGGNGVSTPSTRTAEQTEIGLFWIESSPLAWNRLARAISDDEGLDLWENARLFGLLNLALADGYIASWNAKYHYKFWRPITAVRLGDADGNPDTEGDADWTPLQPTYPMPDHDSAHAVEGGAAAEVLKQFFGTDHIPFSACSLSLPAGSTCADPSPILRRFATFSEAAAENAVSRIYIGIHFRNAVEEGVKHGRKIGLLTVNRTLKPVR